MLPVRSQAMKEDQQVAKEFLVEAFELQNELFRLENWFLYYRIGKCNWKMERFQERGQTEIIV